MTARKYALVFILAISLVRLILPGKGALCFYDEIRYTNTIEFFKAILEERDFKKAALTFNGITEKCARPGEMALRMPGTLVQALVYKATGILPLDHRSLVVQQVFNIAVAGLLAWLLFLLAAELTRSQWLGFWAVVVYSLLQSASLHLRHIFPYDTALAICLGSLLLAVRLANGTIQRRRLLWFALSGFLAGFAFVTYPGYYLFSAIIAVFLFIFADFKHLANSMLQLAAWGFAALLPIALFEAIAQYGGDSLIKTFASLSATIVQGQFSESFTYVPNYLWFAEHFVGLLLCSAMLAACSMALIPALRNRLYENTGPYLPVVFVLLAAAWLYYSINGYVLHKMVWYERLVKMYLPAMAIAAVLVLQYLAEQLRMRPRHVFLGLAIFSLFHFAWFMWQYVPLQYPRETIYRLGIDANKAGYNQFVSENLSGNSHISYPRNLPAASTAPVAALQFLNYGVLYPLTPDSTGYKRYAPVPGSRLLASIPHPCMYKPYQFMGYGLNERKAVDERNYQFQIWQLPAAVSADSTAGQ